MPYDYRSPDFAPQPAQSIGADFGSVNPQLFARAPQQQQSTPQQQQSASEPKRKKRGFLNIIGEIADAMAVIGGEKPMYYTQDDRDREARDAQQQQYNQEQQRLSSNDAAKQEREQAVFGAAQRKAHMDGMLTAGRAISKYARENPGKDVNEYINRVSKVMGLSEEQVGQLSEAGAEGANALVDGQEPPREAALAPFLQLAQAASQSPDPKVRAAAEAEIRQQTYIAPVPQREPRADDTPSNIREASWYAAASPSQRAAFDKVNGSKAQRSGTQATAKQLQDQQNRLNAADSFQNTTQDFIATLGELKKSGAFVESGKPISNLGRSIANTGVGRFAGSVFGTRNEELKQQLEATSPSILQSALGMMGVKAAQMNTEKEYQRFAKILGDPNASYETRMKAVTGLSRFVQSYLGRGQDSPKGGAPSNGWSAIQRK
jgi:hypothetical protein